jgi:hypothetical protein
MASSGGNRYWLGTCASHNDRGRKLPSRRRRRLYGEEDNRLTKAERDAVRRSVRFDPPVTTQRTNQQGGFVSALLGFLGLRRGR